MDYTVITQTLINVGIKLLGAVFVLIIGRVVIGWTSKIVRKLLERQKIEPTVARYLASTLSVFLNIALAIGILGYFGFETTTFAAFIAAAGIAIGTAWSGLLAHFAAGVFLIMLRPIKVGDFVTAAGITGTVKDIGLFVTIIETMDNVSTIVGNSKLFGDNIMNYSVNPYRRVDLVAQLAHGVDVKDAIERLRRALPGIPNVKTDPAPVVQILEFNLAGPVLCVRPFCHTDDYWQVYFDTNMLIRTTFGEAAYPVPETHHRLQQRAGL